MFYDLLWRSIFIINQLLIFVFICSPCLWHKLAVFDRVGWDVARYFIYVRCSEKETKYRRGSDLAAARLTVVYCMHQSESMWCTPISRRLYISRLSNFTINSMHGNFCSVSLFSLYY